MISLRTGQDTCKGKMGLSNLKISTQIVGPKITRQTVINNPTFHHKKHH